MSNQNSSKKTNYSSAWTNAGKAKDLLKKYGLLDSKEVIATPTVLKVLFGKGGVLRLLNDAWLTSNEISYFNSMVKVVLNAYAGLKLYNIQNSNGLYDEIYNLQIELSSINWNNLGEWSNYYKKQIRILEYEIRNLHLQRNMQNDNAMEHFTRAQEVNSTFKRAQANFEGVQAEIRAAKLNKAANKKIEEKINVINNEKQLFKYVNNITSKIKKIIKTTHTKIEELTGEIKNLEYFCEICNKQGKTYYKQKQVGFLSFKVNKLKKEAARILMIIKPN